MLSSCAATDLLLIGRFADFGYFWNNFEFRFFILLPNNLHIHITFHQHSTEKLSSSSAYTGYLKMMIDTENMLFVIVAVSCD